MDRGEVGQQIVVVDQHIVHDSRAWLGDDGVGAVFLDESYMGPSAYVRAQRDIVYFPNAHLPEPCQEPARVLSVCCIRWRGEQRNLRPVPKVGQEAFRVVEIIPGVVLAG